MKTFIAKPTLAAILAAILALFLFLAPAEAHNVTPTSASPADQAVLAQAPSEVYLTFPEEISENGSTLQVFDQQGRQVDLGKGGVDLNDPNHAALVVKLPAPLTPWPKSPGLARGAGATLPQGAYLVKWKVALLDGDSSSGAYYFGVGSVTWPADPPVSAVPAARAAAAMPWPIAGAALAAVVAAALVLRRRILK